MAEDKNKLKVFKKTKTFNIYFWKEVISKQEKVKSACWGTMKHVNRWEKRQHKSPLGIHSPAGQMVFSGAGRVDARVRAAHPATTHAFESLGPWWLLSQGPEISQEHYCRVSVRDTWEIRHRWRVRRREAPAPACLRTQMENQNLAASSQLCNCAGILLPLLSFNFL